MAGIDSIDKLREWSYDVCDCECVKEIQQIADEIEREIEDKIDDLMATSVDGYPEPFNTPDAMHMVLGTAADCFGTPQEAVHYLRGETSMLLPVDADGTPIHVGDGIRISVNKTVAAEFVRCDAVAFEHGDGLAWKLADGVRNVQNRTVEDVLRELAEAVSHEHVGEAYLDLLLSDYADEIRELLGVSE